MAGGYDMERLKLELVVEYQRLELECECIRSLAERLRREGMPYEAEELEEAEQHVSMATQQIRKAWKFLPGEPRCEQIKMDV